MQESKQSLIIWNNTFPFDRLYRQKYKIAFGSKEHREVSQIDVYYDILEDRLFGDFYEELVEGEKIKLDYANDGILNKESVESIEEDLNDIFDSMDITKLNDNKDG